ncbi:hypothetical protein JFL43_20445 [Viridibacillus sp. YIM B01967]|uniref:Lipoprotein n=1 Tax=Viridibacillus soli TaxID=2798301 RepID=A0ABS1HCP7_9BACL|nr:hypothetical protein [Viridibacillus soli]MBK3497156.1 hypothetical protein [Viridibacillus soli]
MTSCITSGCSNQEEPKNVAQKITVQKLYSQGNYGDINKVFDTIKVANVVKLLGNTKWEKATVEMDRKPDYKFIIEPVYAEASTKQDTYSMWISQNKDTIEVIKGTDKYVHLNKDDANKWYHGLLGVELKATK